MALGWVFNKWQTASTIIRDLACPTRREPRRLENDARARTARGDRPDPLGDPGPGAVASHGEAQRPARQRDRRRSSCARTASRSPSMCTTTSSTAARPSRRASSACPSTKSSDPRHAGRARATARRADASATAASASKPRSPDRLQEGRAVHDRGRRSATAASTRSAARLAVPGRKGDAGVRRGERSRRCRGSTSTAASAATWSDRPPA